MYKWRVTMRNIFGYDTPHSTFDIQAVFSDGHWWIPRGTQAITWRHRVYIKDTWDSPPDRLATHTMCHVHQYDLYGKSWLSAIRFVAVYAWQWIVSKFKSEIMPFEAETMMWETIYCDLSDGH